MINYPARGIGQTTIDRILIAANEQNISMFEVLENLDQLQLEINTGIKTKLQNFVNMIKSFQIEASSKNAFEVADMVIKQTD